MRGRPRPVRPDRIRAPEARHRPARDARLGKGDGAGQGPGRRYARALPADHGWPPFLLIADIGYCIEVYADFTGTGKAYAQFPDRSRYRVMLDDLRDAQVRKRLAAIWTEPKSLDPSAQAAQVTRAVANLLATVSRRLEARSHSAETVSGFLMRVLFTMFAEDTGVLLPRDSFKTLLRGQLDHPEHLHHQLSALWRAMDSGAFAPGLGIPVKHFNGYLFKDAAALPVYVKSRCFDPFLFPSNATSRDAPRNLVISIVYLALHFH